MRHGSGDVEIPPACSNGQWVTSAPTLAALANNAIGAAFHDQDVSAFAYRNLDVNVKGSSLLCWIVFDQGYIDRYGFPITGGKPGVVAVFQGGRLR